MRTIESHRVEEQAKHILLALLGRQFGSVHPLEGAIDVGEDSTGEDAVFFEVILDDPATGSDTWSFDDMQTMRQWFGEQIRRSELEVIAYLQVRPRTMDAPEDDGTDV